MRQVLFLLLLLAFPARAAVSLTAYADRQSAAVGDTVNIAAFVEVGAGDAFTGGSVYLWVPTAGSVTLTSVNYHGSVVFSGYVPSNQPPLSDFNTSYDLGGDVQDINSALHEGRYLLGIYSLLIERYVPILRVEFRGDDGFGLGSGYFRDAGFVSYPYTAVDETEIFEGTEDGVVPTVPEPGVLMLAGAVIVGGLRNVRRPCF